MGVGFVPRYTVLKEIKTGRLLELFPETELLNDQINIYLKKRNFEKKAFKDLVVHIRSLSLGWSSAGQGTVEDYHRILFQGGPPVDPLATGCRLHGRHGHQQGVDSLILKNFKDRGPGVDLESDRLLFGLTRVPEYG